MLRSSHYPCLYAARLHTNENGQILPSPTTELYSLISHYPCLLVPGMTSYPPQPSLHSAEPQQLDSNTSRVQPFLIRQFPTELSSLFLLSNLQLSSLFLLSNLQLSSLFLSSNLQLFSSCQVCIMHEIKQQQRKIASSFVIYPQMDAKKQKLLWKTTTPVVTEYFLVVVVLYVLQIRS